VSVAEPWKVNRFNVAGILANDRHWKWPLTVSTPERAILELLDEIPMRETFHQADVLMEGLRSLSPRRLQTLLLDCRSVKVKRLFFWFAERHRHAWLQKLDRSAIDLGTGKRMLVRGGKLDPKYNITVPENLDGGL
jgi:Transcriptional regulator, AbiEi antitoxin, Type IV TA system